MAKTATKYRVTFPDGSYEIHEAYGIDQDGSGMRLLNEDGTKLAAWTDGQYKSVAPDVKREGGPAK